MVSQWVKKSIYSTNELGKLANTNNVYIYDSSCLNDIDTANFSINMLNIIRMIMENEKLPIYYKTKKYIFS